MKRILIAIVGCIWLTACGPTTGQSGTNNDGFKDPGDPNGAMKDSSGFKPDPTLDTSIGDNRVDTEQRDTSKRSQ